MSAAACDIAKSSAFESVYMLCRETMLTRISRRMKAVYTNAVGRCVPYFT
jgi:hypothetical protein